MIKFETIIETVETKKVESIQCDKCKKEYDVEDVFEIQEFHHIKFGGGWGSVFGDESAIDCDICQHCLKEMIGEICRYNGLTRSELLNVSSEKKQEGR